MTIRCKKEFFFFFDNEDAKKIASLFKALMTISKSLSKIREDSPIPCARIKAMTTVITSTDEIVYYFLPQKILVYYKKCFKKISFHNNSFQLYLLQKMCFFFVVIFKIKVNDKIEK